MPTISSESNTDDENLVATDACMSSSLDCDHDAPQVFSQATMSQAYQQVPYSPYHYPVFPISQVGATIPGYVNMIPYDLQQPQASPV